jgi:hypothetical protein
VLLIISFNAESVTTGEIENSNAFINPQTLLFNPQSEFRIPQWELFMPTWLKVMLIVGGILVVMVVGLVVAGVYVARRYVPELVEAGKQTIAEGEQYGRRSDNEGCLNEAVARHSRSEGLTDLIKVNIFLRACLDTSRPTQGFCDNVPRQTEFVKSAQWQMEQCKHYGLTPEKQCGQLFQTVQQFCYMPHRRAPDADYDNSNADDEPPPPPPMPTPPPAPVAPKKR